MQLPKEGTLGVLLGLWDGNRQRCTDVYRLIDGKPGIRICGHGLGPTLLTSSPNALNQGLPTLGSCLFCQYRNVTTLPSYHGSFCAIFAELGHLERDHMAYKD